MKFSLELKILLCSLLISGALVWCSFNGLRNAAEKFLLNRTNDSITEVTNIKSFDKSTKLVRDVNEMKLPGQTDQISPTTGNSSKPYNSYYEEQMPVVVYSKTDTNPMNGENKNWNENENANANGYGNSMIDSIDIEKTINPVNTADIINSNPLWSWLSNRNYFDSKSYEDNYGSDNEDVDDVIANSVESSPMWHRNGDLRSTSIDRTNEVNVINPYDNYNDRFHSDFLDDFNVDEFQQPNATEGEESTPNELNPNAAKERLNFVDGKVFKESNQELTTENYSTATTMRVYPGTAVTPADIQTKRNFPIFTGGLKLFRLLCKLFSDCDWLTILMGQQPQQSPNSKVSHSISLERHNGKERTYTNLHPSNERNKRDMGQQAIEAEKKSITDAKYIKGDPLKGYYDFVVTEGSYKFWAVFQVGTALLIIYSTFAAIYYSKINPLVSDYDYVDYLGGGRALTDGNYSPDFVDMDSNAQLQQTTSTSNWYNWFIPQGVITFIQTTASIIRRLFNAYTAATKAARFRNMTASLQNGVNGNGLSSYRIM